METESIDNVSTKSTFREYIFECWRKGWKTTKIIENYDKDVSEKDVKDIFKFTLDSHFERLKHETN